MEAKLLRPKSLTDLAIERIRAAIVEGRLALGAQISEAALAAQLGISKTPVREALLRLKLDGLVEIHPQRGTFVFQVSDAEVGEICRFRAILETAALAEAMANDRDALVARLEQNLAAMAKVPAARKTKDLPALDEQFHAAIIERCGNAYLRTAYQLIEHKIHALRWRLPENDAQVEHCQENHAAIVEQIRAGDVRKVQATLERHIHETHSAYVAASKVAVASARRSGSRTA